MAPWRGLQHFSPCFSVCGVSTPEDVRLCFTTLMSTPRSLTDVHVHVNLLLEAFTRLSRELIAGQLRARGVRVIIDLKHATAGAYNLLVCNNLPVRVLNGIAEVQWRLDGGLSHRTSTHC
jgi:hypothetical protein